VPELAVKLSDMRTTLAGFLLLLLVPIGSVALACDPPAFAPDKMTANDIVKDAAFVWVSRESFMKLGNSLFEQSTPSLKGGISDHVCAASLAGAPVLRIRVTALRMLPEPSKHAETEQWSEAVDKIFKVCTAESEADGNVFWQEYTEWSISAVIEYANGREGYLLTDGIHSKFQDTLGYHWYLYTPPFVRTKRPE
jgi:hypothetical protein